MPKSISVANAIELARIESNTPYLILLDIDVVDPSTSMVVETISLVRNPEAFTYNGTIYNPIKFDIELKEELGKQADIQLHIVDYSQAIQSRMELYDGGIGFGVTLTIQNADLTNAPPELVETFDVVSAEAANYIVSFSLGAVNALADAFPRRSQTKDFCQWRYKENLGCRYGQTLLNYFNVGTGASDNLKKSSLTLTTLNKAIVASIYVGGMTVGKNFTVELRDASNTLLANGVFTPASSNTVSFTSTAGSVGWQKLDSDVIRVWVRAPSGVTSNQSVSLIVYPSSGSSAAANDGLALGCAQVEVDVLQPTDYEHNSATAPTFVRNKMASSNEMTSLYWTLTNLTPNTSVTGLFGPNIGTISTCDYTLKGTNGCEAHGNQINFGAFPGLNANNVRYA